MQVLEPLIYSGRRIEKIPENRFRRCRQDNLRSHATLALVAMEIVPKQAEWQLISLVCGGFEHYDEYLACHYLVISPDKQSLVDYIASEKWFPGGLNYSGMCREDSKELMTYQSVLRSHGLSFESSNMVNLSQALYPLDPTWKNIQHLTNSPANLLDIDPENNCGLVLMIIGANCE